LENLSLIVPSGKFFALLGPSGSGKTTLLRLIAGFEKADQGTIFLGNDDITHLPINERRINTVFQNYALFPHMNVFDNVAYGLRIKRVAPFIVRQKVERFLEIVSLERYAQKSIQQLSGGQQQRVALVRAIINEPAVLLLDEPLAALDLKLREKMLLELIEIQDELKTTFVYVTHDQSEALTVADYMAIMNENGAIEQIGTPKEIYEYPISSFVAKFVGTTNIFKGSIRIESGIGYMDVENLGTLNFIIDSEKKWQRSGSEVLMSIRPEKIEISKIRLDNFSNYVDGGVESIVYHGRSTQYNIRLKNNHLMRVFEQNTQHTSRQLIDYDDHVYLHWHSDNVVMLER
jgi:spermidine/putrescine transport system ATP-binding protein